MGEHDAETMAMLRLCLCEGLGTLAAHRLLAHFGSAQASLSASENDLAPVPELPPRALRALKRPVAEDSVEAELRLVAEAGVRLVPVSSPEYPSPLRFLDEAAPPLLWMLGSWQASDRLAMALVGARRCTHYGRSQAQRFAGGLAAMGFTIVSGLARGIDTASHRAAVRAGGRTIGVAACGLGTLRSGAETDLADAVAQNGAVISELPMTTPARPGNFPPRNRLISGLAPGVLVVEAAARSGSLITARYAGEQGRTVFALPGPVDSPASRGTHALIRDGAILVQDPREIVEALGPLSEPLVLTQGSCEPNESHVVDDPRVLALNQRERQIYDLLAASPIEIDRIIDETALPASIVSSVLLTLEIRGLARQLPGQRYARP